MLKYYQELSLLPQEEIPIHFLWSKVFQQIHLGQINIQDGRRQVPIGISFPEYVAGEKYCALGSKCRLFAKDGGLLDRFDATKWLDRLSDYVHCTRIRPVPEKLTGYAIYQRQQPKTNKERLARRYANRHGISFDEAFRHYGDMAPIRITAPYIRLKSLSSDHTFCLWIKKTVVSESSETNFNSYGLSATATIPEF